MFLTILIISLMTGIIGITISNITIIIRRISLTISKVSIIIHGSAPLRKKEILGMPTMY